MSDELQPINDYRPRQRAADDVETIFARLAELRREREAAMNPAPTMEES